MSFIKKKQQPQIDWLISIIPIILVILLCIYFTTDPQGANLWIAQIRFYFTDTFGLYYLAIGLAVFLFSFYISFSAKYGNIILGSPDEKPIHSFRSWGAMMFTAGLAADILFYSFSEWILYATDEHVKRLGAIQDWASVFPLFHWGLIPWSFYLTLAVAFGFMLHVKKSDRQRFSEACRPVLGKYTDGYIGRCIDLMAVFALLAGTATTFSLATPLMAAIINNLFHLSFSITFITIVILLITCIIYTYSLLHGIKGIDKLAHVCIYLFFFNILYVLFFGGATKYILETGFYALGCMLQNFFTLATYTDPLRTTSFPQKWTIFYWAYWMVWCVAVPFFIGRISQGRTVRQVIWGGYFFGAGSTMLSFTIFGNYSMGLQVLNKLVIVSQYSNGGDMYEVIISVLSTLPAGASLFMMLILLNMILFYATSFDAIAFIGALYSYTKLSDNRMPGKIVQFTWCILLILFPIALIFSESSMSNLQSVSIIAAFPIGIIIVMILISFIKGIR